MFDISGSELLLVGAVALVVLGPKEIPPLLRNLGRMVGKARRVVNELKATLDELTREVEESKKEEAKPEAPKEADHHGH